jgi:hypothetical protein
MGECIVKVAPILATVMLLTGQAYAQDKAWCEEPEVGGTMSERTYNVVAKAIEALGEDRNQEAEKNLQSLTDKVKDYERAIVFQTLGFAQIQQDRMAAALISFEEALATQALPRQAGEDLLLNTGQIYLAERQLDKAIYTLERFIARTCNPVKAEVHLALGSALAEKEQYREALVQVEIALQIGETVREQWLQLKLALHYQLGEMVQSAETLIRLLVLMPGKDAYWRQLSGVLLEIDKEEDALAVLAIAESQGFIRAEKELKNLANLYMMLEIPYKAASLMDQGLEQGTIAATAENFEYLSEAWISAYEWQQAETTLQSAAELSDDGELWQRLAQVRIENEDWAGARDALQLALEKGVVDPGRTHYLLGISAYNSNDPGAAISALQSAVRFDSFREEARQWLTHIQNEQ